MSKYTVNYYFNGNGSVEVEANSEQEAKEAFYSGEYELDNDSEWGDEFVVEEILKNE